MSARTLRGGLALAVLGLVLGAAGCGERSTVADHLAEAETLMEAGEFQEASIELRNALKLDPQNAETNFRIGELMEEQGQLEDAIFFYGEAHRLDPTRSDAAVHEASLLIFDDPVRTKELIADVLERDPSNAFAHVVLSRRAVIETKLDEALGHVLTALELDPDSQPAYLQLGKIHQARIRKARLQDEEPDPAAFEEAVAAFEKAIEIDEHRRSTHQAYHERAKVLAIQEGKQEEAAEAYRQAVEAAIASGNPGIARKSFQDAQRFALRSQNRDLTIWILEQQIDFDPADLSAWNNLAILKEAEGEDISGLATRLLEARPEDPAAHAWYARYLADLGRLDEGVAHLQQKIAEDVDPPVLLGALSTLLADEGRAQEAAAYAERLRREYPDHPRAVIVAAQEAVEERRFQDAADALRELVVNYDRPDAYSLLATAERELGNPEAALEAIARFVELTPSGPAHARAVLVRAQIEAQVGDCQASLRSYTRVVRLGKTLAPVDQFLQARCLYTLGRTRIARAALERLFADGRRPAYAVVEWIDREGADDPERARELGEEALARYPNHAGLLARMANFDVLDGHPQQAIARFNKAIESGQVAPLVVLDRARTHYILGNLELAERDALRAFEADPGLEGAGALLLTIYAQQGRTEEAIRSFEEAHAVGALRPPARALLAKLHLQNDNETRAREILDELVSDPELDLPGAKNDLAYLLAQNSKDLDRALQLAQEAQRSMPKRAGVADTLGYVYLKRGLYDPALQQFRYAMSLVEGSSTPAVFHYHEGLALQGLGRTDEAIAAFEKTLEVDDTFEDAAEALRAARADGAGAGGTS